MSTTWFKSSFSGADKTCVEVANRHEAVLIRDSKYSGPESEQPIITVPTADWSTLLDLVLSRTSGVAGAGVYVTVTGDGGGVITAGTTRLSYDSDEWNAFTKGVADGQFTRY